MCIIVYKNESGSIESFQNCTSTSFPPTHQSETTRIQRLSSSVIYIIYGKNIYITLHCSFPGNGGIPGNGPSILGIPSSSNSKSGANSFIISAGGWPYSCISCINSIKREKLLGSVS
mmetsp:Transcript_40602/g.59349  ORF Transcript_40602/g.59349 Transcript_40602/m.59349 type:complete len:117 (+) Transcript_40602:92-442(+)